ncbi:PAS domain S-box protein [Desulfotomaculum sp. 1211_IL3151]|uniref:PAS domain S-box protein n=1 Tax=Desulfotomaculum sp. 1211_IL3151 TaxID=3084055 RepID=UPI002FD89C49
MNLKLRVLIIEDSEDDLHLLLRELREGGYAFSYRWVKDRQEMSQALSVDWDIILSDYVLPQFSGLEALKMIRERGLELPFIMLSGQISEVTAVEAIRAGAQDYIVKGNLSRLIPAIQRELREAKLRKEKRQVEKSLQASEEKFCKIFHASPDIMAILSLPDLIFIDVNASWLAYTGNHREAVIGKTVMQLNSILRFVDHDKLFQLLREYGSVHNEEVYFRRPSGEINVVLGSASMIKLDGKSCVFVVAKDITHLKGMQQAAETSEARFQAMFEKSFTGIGIMDGEGTVLHGNTALKNILGYSTEDFIGVNTRQVTHPDDIAKNMIYYRQLASGKLDYYQMEKRYIRKDGKVVWANMSVTAIRDAQGKFIQAIAFVEDITQRKKNEIKLRQLAAIVESSDDGIISKDPRGIIVSWNAGAERIYGYTEEEAIGRHFSFLCPDNNRCEEEIMDAVRNGRRLHNYETVRQRKDGRIIQVAHTISPIYDLNGRFTGVSTVVRDITEHKEMEKEMLRLDRLNLVGEMAAGISHEVRNPMTTVKGFLQILRDKPDCVQYMDYYNLMIDELDRANSIISEFLSIGRSKTTEMTMQNLNDILHSLAPLIQADAVGQGKNIYLETSKVPDLLLNDKEIRQVILNLARNGLEAMSQGYCLRIRTFVDNDDVVLAVQDQGTGILPEQMEKLGTPFYTTKEKGTGLGLANCFSVVARHRGTIQVESGSGGTTFYVKFKVSC